MNEHFRELVNALDAKYQALCEMAPIVASDVPKNTPVGGVYLFSEDEQPLYAGRTKRSIGARIKYHFCTANDCGTQQNLHAARATEVTEKRRSTSRVLLPAS